MLRFKVGDIVEFAVTIGDFVEGEEVEIVKVGPFAPGDEYDGLRTDVSCDYFIRYSTPGPYHHGISVTNDNKLRKRKPPKEEHGDWDEIERFTGGWNPTRVPAETA